MEEITIKIYPISAFVFELEGAANGVSVEVDINYYIKNMDYILFTDVICCKL